MHIQFEMPFVIFTHISSGIGLKDKTPNESPKIITTKIAQGCRKLGLLLTSFNYIPSKKVGVNNQLQLYLKLSNNFVATYDICI